MDTDGVIQCISLVFLLLLSAFFSSAETALTTVNRMKLRSRADEGDKKATTALKLLERPAKMLSTVLIANNVVNISASSLATTIALRLWGNKSVALITGLLTLLVLIFGEITPKTMASLYSEGLARAYSPWILYLSKILTPVIFVIDLLSNGLLRLFHIDADSARTAMTEYELRTIVDVSHEDGVIESEERQMIYNVVDFGDSLAKDIMIPRIEMSCVSADATYEELKEVFFEEKYTRIPVYEGSTDNIIGIINMKDVLFPEHIENFNIREIMREASFTFEYKKTSELMIEMRENSISLILVLDEYGATVGLITLEDLLEEIVGEIRDEFDEDEKNLIQPIDERTYLVEGSLKLDDINDALGLSLASEDYDSIGGLIIEQLDRLPDVLESVELPDGTVLEVVEMDKNRIDKVRMTLPEKEETVLSDLEDTSASAVPEQES